MSNLRNSSNYMWSTSQVLGKGATGSVYQGLHRKTGDSVAVKTFNHHSHLRPVEVQMREFEVMKVLSHENIVKMVAIEDEVVSQKKVLVMELCNGGSLFTILDDPQNSYGLEEEEFLCVLKDLSAGMKYLRDNNIIHRDLKPGNIMKFTSEDGQSIYKLTDFGAARVLDDDQQFMSLYGTEEYLHPDMYKSAVLEKKGKNAVKSRAKSFSATVDLWSIGVTLYHVATGSLPFRPFGGRLNRDTMFCITTNKAVGVISGVQHSEKGPIEWSKELPKTCLLNQGLRDLVTNLLAGILECNDKKMWTFDQFFDCVTDIFSRKVFHIFYMNEGKEICLYLQPNKTFQDLKDQINGQTKVSSSNQLLLFDKSLFVSQINTSAEISTFPSTSLDQPLILVHMENTNVKDLTRLGAMSACFPNFPSSVNIDNDASLAKTCCSVAHAMKRLVIKLVRCRTLLLKIPKILIPLSVESVTKICSNSDVLKQKTEDVNYRSDLLDRNCSLVSQFVSLWPNQQDYENEFLKIDKLLSDKRKLKDQVKQKVFHLVSAIHILKQRVLISKRLQKEWEQALSECTSLVGCVERADTYAFKMRDSWQAFIRDRSLKVALSAHDQQFHMLERVKVQQTSKKLVSLLQDQCLKACLDASSKLDEWYSGMQATMVQCRCFETDLISAGSDLKCYSASLQKAESESFEISEKIIALQRHSEVPVNTSNSKDSNLASRGKEITVKNEEVSTELRSSFTKKVLNQMQHLKDEQMFCCELAEENSAIVNKLCSFFEDVMDMESTLKIESTSDSSS